MAQHTPRNESDNEPTTTTAPSARPAKASNRRRSARETTAATKPSSSPDASQDRSAEAASATPAEGTSSNDRVRPADPVNADPSEEDIRVRAYLRYLERGGGHGLEFDDWVEAERELRTRNHGLKTDD